MAVLVEITDPADPRLGDYRDLRDVELRKHLEAEHGLFLAEGEKVVRRAVEAGYAPRSFLMAPRWLDGLADVLDRSEAPCYVVSEALAEEVTGFHVHRGALASLERRPLPSVDEVLAGARSVLVLEDIVDHTNVCSMYEIDQTARTSDLLINRKPPLSRIAVFEDLVDHANVGAGFRNAAALGIDAVVLSPRCADPLYRRAIKVSMGATLQLPWTRLEPWPRGLQQLRDAGYLIAGMALSDDAITLDELSNTVEQNIAIMFGTEGHGLTRRALAECDVLVRIPMQTGIDSLNVAAASAVAFYATRIVSRSV
ncbi:RNA methyltransferase [Nocardioides albidus]|uniref:RNA methyltransferase n=1 Tax=Nocardioides albidus TaxID=1517589 RepID=A0A5C4VV67_9ACTN|nr:RNA methyltransferase [Nocardioides albidus]TNM39671.1 RNA methyltransferase [Nocardioides albidus]